MVTSTQWNEKKNEDEKRHMQSVDGKSPISLVVHLREIEFRLDTKTNVDLDEFQYELQIFEY